MSVLNKLVDSTDIGVVANCLEHPQSPINYVLHVRSEDLLGPLAEHLVEDMTCRRLPAHLFNQHLNIVAAEWELRVSSRHPAPEISASHQISMRDIPRLARSLVICLPPFYLAHTPGLFEGKLVRPKPQSPPTINAGAGMKI